MFCPNCKERFCPTSVIDTKAKEKAYWENGIFCCEKEECQKIEAERSREAQKIEAGFEFYKFMKNHELTKKTDEIYSFLLANPKAIKLETVK